MSFRRISALVSTVALMGTAAVAGPSASADDHDDLGDRSPPRFWPRTGPGSTTTRGTTTSSTTPRAVLKAKPDSDVKVLTDGDTALTAFLPNDRAFFGGSSTT